VLVAFRDVNSGMGTWLDGVRYEDDFLLVGDTRTRPEPRWVRVDIFFHPTGTRYFSTVMILGCEEVKMYSFYDINYDLF
jgi:hypothetical protein